MTPIFISGQPFEENNKGNNIQIFNLFQAQRVTDLKL